MQESEFEIVVYKIVAILSLHQYVKRLHVQFRYVLKMDGRRHSIYILLLNYT